MAEILVLVDHVDGTVRKTTTELLTIARRAGRRWTPVGRALRFIVAAGSRTTSVTSLRRGRPLPSGTYRITVGTTSRLGAKGATAATRFRILARTARTPRARPERTRANPDEGPRHRRDHADARRGRQCAERGFHGPGLRDGR